MTQPFFVPGIELCRRFYWEAVRPALDVEFPRLAHSAALIGPGSEVLGFDTPVSTDHHWGPRAMLFLREDDFAAGKDRLFEAFRWRLPHRFLGYPTNFAQPVPEDPGTRLLRATERGPIDHRVEVFTLPGFLLDQLGVDPHADLAAADWLSFPQQKLRTLVGGEVYHDGIGLEAVRGRFACYPHDVWLYMLASGWTRIGQEEHLMGRAGQAGDELGSALIAARLVRDAMSLCFLMEKQYAPYPKWFGTAFMRLESGPELRPKLDAVLRASSWQERDGALAPVYEFLAHKHNALRLTEPVAEAIGLFWGRPFHVIHGERFADALKRQIRDEEVRRLAERGLIGNVDQVSDNPDVVQNTPHDVLKRLFEPQT
jgi:hypothetical protein